MTSRFREIIERIDADTRDPRMLVPKTVEAFAGAAQNPASRGRSPLVRGAPIVALALLLMHAPGAEAQRRSKELTPAQRGRLVAEARCAGCHAIERGRDSSSPRAPGFATREMRHTAGLEGRLKDLARRGHYEMPAMTLDDREIADLLAYIETLADRR